MPKTFSLKEFPNPKYLNDITKHPDIYETQIKALENYCEKYDETDNSITTYYVKSTEYGRYFVKDPNVLSCTIMWNKIRATLFGESDYDLDIVNCHNELLLTLLKNNTNYDIKNLEYYCTHRTEVIDAIDIERSAINHYNNYNKDNKTKKDIVKSLFTIILYGGTIDTWKTEFGINNNDFKLTAFVKDYIDEIQMNTNIIINDKRFKTIVESVKVLKIKEAKDKYKKKFNIEKFKLINGAVLSVILQEYETLIIEEAMNIMANHGATITSYNYDGFQIRKVDNIDELVNTLNFYINKSNISHSREVNPFVFDNIKFIVKPFRDALDIKVVVLDSLNPNYDIKEMIKTTNYKLQKIYFERFHAKIENPFCYIRDDENGIMFIKPKDLNSIYKNVVTTSAPKDNPKESSAKFWGFVDGWLSDENMKTYYTFNYYPNSLLCPSNCKNLWKPFPILKTVLNPDVDTSKIYAFINTLLGECAEYVLNWFAHIVQKPERKTEVCILLYGSQGCGKSTIGEYLLRKIIGLDKMIITSKADKMFGRFVNTQGKLLAVLNEASGKDTFNICDILKDAITCTTTEQEKKGIDVITITDYTNYVFTTNNINSVKVPEDDRRFMPIEINNILKNNVSYFKELYADLDNDLIMRKFYDELINRDLSKFNPSRDRIETELMKDMKAMNRNCIKDFIDYWKEKVISSSSEDGNFMEKRMSGSKLYDCFNHFWKMEGRKDESKPTLKKFGTELKQYKDDVKCIRSNGIVYEIILVK
jgi:hypothetical protein